MSQPANTSPTTRFGDTMRALRELDLFLELALEGYSFAESANVIRKILAESDMSFDGEDAKTRSQELEAFATNERELGRPFLFGLATVRLWSILEALVEDIVVCSIVDEPAVSEREPLFRLKGPLVAFARQSQEERADTLYNMLEESVAARFKKGVGRFEAVLGALGLDGGISDSVRRTLLELSEIRHAVAHRNGLIDRKLKGACPWIDGEVGERIRFSPKRFYAYSSAVRWYSIELSRRVIIAYPDKVSQGTASVERHGEILAHLDNAIAKALSPA